VVPAIVLTFLALDPRRKLGRIEFRLMVSYSFGIGAKLLRQNVPSLSKIAPFTAARAFGDWMVIVTVL
jgi:hypothetical protein